jgi:hypothetical protein
MRQAIPLLGETTINHCFFGENVDFCLATSLHNFEGDKYRIKQYAPNKIHLHHQTQHNPPKFKADSGLGMPQNAAAFGVYVQGNILMKNVLLFRE